MRDTIRERLHRRPHMAPAPPPPAPRTDDELEERLSRPDRGVVDALAGAPGDVVVLGAGGKMGPSLATMLRRAADTLGDGRRVVAVSRFSSPDAEAPNVIYMAGQKFGTSDLPARTWWINTVVPALVAERYAGARMVAFSTGN